MIVWISLIGGIILGWLIEWVIDWLYWRRGAEAFYTMEHELRQELAAARRQLAEAQATIDHLRAQLPPDAQSSASTNPHAARPGDKTSQLARSSGAGGSEDHPE